ncbi:MAG: hypothetical protein HY858_17125 [Candidatus Solibacter usitatus]|nr:hypothetical protein [Candidatus Solibacter usitatus]
MHPIDLTRREWLALAASVAPAAPAPATTPAELALEFVSPPDDARPWVYWFWKNGNISRHGITADLEAMQRVGIGGIIAMEVSLTTPKGPVAFFSPQWRELFRHAMEECARLGLQIEMNSAPGWTGSGGAWVTPERSMQKVTASETHVQGPARFDAPLPQPESVRGFYRDVAVLAFPSPAAPHRIDGIREKALYVRGPYSSQPGVRPAFEIPSRFDALPPEQVIAANSIIDLSSRMDSAGRLTWDVPSGNWTILRFGHTSTGQTNRPAPSEGLECDKLERAALEDHFREFTSRLVADAGAARKALAGTHLDSWEVGAQNWSAGFAAEFRRRRGYDPIPFLPVMQGLVVKTLEVSERFLWDLRQTVSDLIAENHGRLMAELARKAGLFLSIEPYDMTPCDDMTLGATADVPMCEFWSGFFDARYSVKEATSVAHVYGRPVVAAEAFTSGPRDAWQLHPASVKANGDWAFSEGINRFVIHRSIHQPFPQIKPGLSLSVHGIHCDRTQTWWELSQPWHRYTARCQHILRQGRWVADALYLSPEGAPNVFQSPRLAPRGYKFDACTPEALLGRVSVRNGRLALPDGMEYRVLVLPESPAMTPQLLGKVRQLVEAGATVIGLPPEKAPGLSGYPECDGEVRRIAGALWGGAAPPAGVAERRAGKGRVVWGEGVAARRKAPGEVPPFYRSRRIWSSEGARDFRRTLEIVPGSADTAVAEFHASGGIQLRVNGALVPQSWADAILDRDRLEGFRRVAIFDLKPHLRQGANEISVNVALPDNPQYPEELAGAISIDRPGAGEQVILTDARWTCGASPALDLGPWAIPHTLSPLHVELYPPSEVVEQVLMGTGMGMRMGVRPDFSSDAPLRFAHRRSATMDIYFVSNGEPRAVEAACTFRVRGRAPELWHPESGAMRPLPEFSSTPQGDTLIPLRFEPEESYFIVFRDKSAGRAPGRNFSGRRTALELSGAWEVTFDPKLGGPDRPVQLATLEDWSKRPEDGIRFYSGTAVYRKPIHVPASLAGSRLALDLGSVREIARVRLNGNDLGILWRRPFHAVLEGVVPGGENLLEIKVTNLWPNRMIGDAHLPEDAEWSDRGRLKAWPEWLLQGRASPTGRYTFSPFRPYTKASPLLPSGLLGPVRLLVET